MIVLAIDPGTTESAYVIWNGRDVLEKAIVKNDYLLDLARSLAACQHFDAIAIEMIACYGMPVGKEVFETCLIIGRLQEIFDKSCKPQLVYRKDVKLHHCQSPRAKDANVRQALIDKYGAPGTKKAQGVTYGIKSHLWSAFAIATFLSETTTQLNNQDNPGDSLGNPTTPTTSEERNQRTKK